MHDQAYQWVTRYAGLGAGGRVLDVGGRNINGTVRDLFRSARSYTALDLIAGPGVDIAADFATWMEPEPYPLTPFDLVLYLEVAEHTPSWRNHIAKAANILQPEGALILTCAGPSRAPHSGIDGGPLRPFEHYENLQLHALHSALLDRFTHVHTEYGHGHPLGNMPPPENPFDVPIGFPQGDLYAIARNPR